MDGHRWKCIWWEAFVRGEEPSFLGNCFRDVHCAPVVCTEPVSFSMYGVLCFLLTCNIDCLCFLNAWFVLPKCWLTHVGYRPSKLSAHTHMYEHMGACAPLESTHLLSLCSAESWIQSLCQPLSCGPEVSVLTILCNYILEDFLCIFAKTWDILIVFFKITFCKVFHI